MIITKTEVERLIKGNDKFKSICPRCGKEMSKYPALSRFADVNICSDCGVAEAIETMCGWERVNFSDWKLGRD